MVEAYFVSISTSRSCHTIQVSQNNLLVLCYNNTAIIIFVWRQIPLFDVILEDKYGATNVTSGIDKVHSSPEDRTMKII
jgi:hypothetical protein